MEVISTKECINNSRRLHVIKFKINVYHNTILVHVVIICVRFSIINIVLNFILCCYASKFALKYKLLVLNLFQNILSCPTNTISRSQHNLMIFFIAMKVVMKMQQAGLMEL